MNARNFRTNLIFSPFDMPAINGIAGWAVTYESEPKLNGNKVILTIKKTYRIFVADKDYEVLSAESTYEIPTSVIKTREDVYAFYKDALLSLDEGYKYQQTQLPMLPNRLFAAPPIGNYKNEIDRVFDLLISRN